MKTLLILRHAQAAGNAAAPTDFERPLTDLGRRQATAQGRFLRRAGLLPDRIATSAALRAAETAELVAQGAGLPPDVQREETLYEAPGDRLLQYVQAAPNDVQRLLLVAHMPGVGELLSLLATEHMDAAVGYKAGTVAVVQVDAPRWDAFNYGTGELAVFFPPLLELE